MRLGDRRKIRRLATLALSPATSITKVASQSKQTERSQARQTDGAATPQGVSHARAVFGI